MTETEYRQTFRQLYPQMAFYATRFVGEEDAEDVVQDAFMELWKHKDDIAGDAHRKSFLYRAVYSRALNVLRHRHVTDSYSEAAKDIDMKRMNYYAPDDNNVWRHIDSMELGMRINNAIEQLPEKCREAFMMSYLHDMKNKDIAAVMNISVRTVDAQIYKALKLLRTRLSDVWLFLLLFWLAR